MGFFTFHIIECDLHGNILFTFLLAKKPHSNLTSEHFVLVEQDMTPLLAALVLKFPDNDPTLLLS